MQSRNEALEMAISLAFAYRLIHPRAILKLENHMMECISKQVTICTRKFNLTYQRKKAIGSIVAPNTAEPKFIVILVHFRLLVTWICSTICTAHVIFRH
jgi:hypothetical protein